MKMNKELFGEVCDAIDKVLSEHSLQTIIKHRENVKFVNSQFVAFCWSMFYASEYDIMKLYNAGLNDSHIETSLKRILSDFA